MVLLSDVQASNDRIASTLPGLVAVFAGATSGIGEYTLKEFARHASRPRVYVVGRSQQAADRILAECQTLCRDGLFMFIQEDLSLLRGTDKVCQQIRSKEKAINLLCLSQGSLIFNKDTEEGLNYGLALANYSRARFIVNLLPLVQKATGLRRVLSIAGGTKEGKLYLDDIDGKNVSLLEGRGHLSSVVTMSLEAIAKEAPDVSFIHNFPGTVKGGAARGTTGIAMGVLKAVFAVAGPFFYINNEECGERHLFLLTSARYPNRDDAEKNAGISLTGNLSLALGTDGKAGSGVYCIDSDGESAGPKTQAILAGHRAVDAPEKIWKHMIEQFKRITGTESLQ